MSVTQNGHPPRKVCFVTIGATAGFDALIRATLSAPFLEALRTLDYTDLRLQLGTGGMSILEEYERSKTASITGKQELNVSGFEFLKQGLGSEMSAAKGGSNGVEGVVISHAGSGSILDALRIAVPLVVVPNPSLLDNHQVELAEELAAQGYVVHGHLDDLPAALRLSESLRKTQHAWPPSNRAEDPCGKGLIGVMDDELGFID